MAKNEAAVKKYNDMLVRYARYEIRLIKCESREQLDSVLSKYRDQQKKSFFVLPNNLKENQYKELNAAKVRIEGLISDLKNKFPASVVVPAEAPLSDDATHEIRMLQMEEVIQRMAFLNLKCDSFGFSGKACNQAAANAANNIFMEMTHLIDQFIQDGDLESFKTASKGVLNEQTSPEVKTLHEHRGWKEALINLAVFIGTLGIVHAAGTIYSSIKNKQLTFFKVQVQTDSAKVLNDLDETAQAVVAASA
ncbi:MAG: hypothetical protein P4L65_07140 [Legionella sp.]|nr:hypothetical protein [Legionella sp.]